ncbi:MAG: anti-sigma 24 factor [Betaproteobacteria bacterium]|nr:MAG: anti-sigma 24 factor [Betaproteobacteria bacterium]
MKENISALMDGELEGRAADETFDLLRRDGEAADNWRLYHLMSDAIRGQRRLVSAGFVERVAARLATEPAVLAPGALPGRTPLQRFALAAAASLAAVALVGWLAFAPPPKSQPPLAQAQPPAAGAPLPDAANDYLLAHQGFSPRVSLQGMAPYVRTVAERPDESSK